jgi:hypothetical protein
MPNDGHQNQKKIQCWIPIETWDKVEALGYSTTAAAATAAFNKLLEYPVNNPEISQDIPIFKARLEEKDKLIEEFKIQINLLTDQLHKKDEQIEKQAYHIQSLIQENVKLLPVNTEVKKKWFEFWK